MNRIKFLFDKATCAWLLLLLIPEDKKYEQSRPIDLERDRGELRCCA